MSEVPEIGAYHTRPPWYWLTLILAGLYTLIMGVWGYWLYDADVYRDWIERFFIALYQTAQLFVLHTPEFTNPPGAKLEIARLMGAFVFFFSILGALWQVIIMEGRHFLYGRRRGHVIICGAGWRGLTLARDYLNKGVSKVIVLERDPDCRGVAECERLGIPYFIGDASDPSLLSSVSVHAACRIVAVCGSDEINLEIAARAAQLKRSSEIPLKCSVHLANDDLRTMVRQKGFAQLENSPIDISTFGTDIYENAARWLFRKTPLDRVPIDQDSALRIHLIIMGFGQMGQAVLTQAACIAHYANTRKLRVTIVDPHARAEFEEYQGRHGGIREIADIEPLERAPHDPTLINLIIDDSRQAGFLTTCVICFPDEKLNLVLAVKFGDVVKDHPIPIRWWLQSRSDAGLGLVFSAKLLDELDQDRVLSFGNLEDVCTVDLLEQEEPNEMGRIIHENYVAEQTAKGESLKDNPSLKPWNLMPESFKNSNRLAADHIVIKMRALGYGLSDQPKTDCISAFNDDQVEILARMEHARYCAERWMDGWKCGVRKDLVAKTNPTLIPWEFPLPEIERVKDRDQVKKIPYILKKAGLYICR